ncbi:helix-turn-helix protein [Actinocorallia herbida]|uniref:Helix-turn-helix protein n=2 Tax=Actinocorallia herbida TaxID=58109 RepID=A0A3N1DCI3_9ACTN|nr:helix-turn-helix protein [Actinocorallia herbida]
MAGHSTWDTLKAKRLRGEAAQEHPEYTQAVRDIDLGNKLREIRTSRNLTQAEVAKNAGITQPALSRIELGGGVPTLDMLDRIGRAMGVRFVISVGDSQADPIDLLAG